MTILILAFLWGGYHLSQANGDTVTAPAQAYKAEAGPHAVQVLDDEWFDQKRNREVPVRVYYPAGDATDLPVIIFSHGLGGSREGYEYLGRHWASHGYASVHIQHKGSDTSVWKDVENPMAAMKAAANARNAISRPLDVRFAIDQVEALNDAGGALGGRLDLGRIGMAGHSFGAYTTLAVVGEVFVTNTGRELSIADPRIKAAIPMSAPVPAHGDLGAAFGKIAVPCLHMTGTLDDSPIGDTGADERRLPFDHSRGPDKYLVTFEGGDHMIFSGRRWKGIGTKDDLFQDLILQSTTAFWDAYLKGDETARQWLADGGFAAVLGANGTFEHK